MESISMNEVTNKRLSKSEITYWVELITQSKILFDDTIKIILNEHGNKAFMGSWLMQYAAVKKPSWFYPHLQDLINRLSNKPDDSVNRAVVRILWKTKIPKDYNGVVAQTCIGWLENKNSSIAVKAFSCHVLSKLIETEPELCPEIKAIIESELPYASSGLGNSISKLLHKISGMGYF